MPKKRINNRIHEKKITSFWQNGRELLCKRMKNSGSGLLMLTVYPFLNKIGMNKNAAER